MPDRSYRGASDRDGGDVAPPSARLEVRDLTVRFGTTTAVAGLDLDLAPGTLTALLGPSGCGKSTTLSVLAGLRAADAGEVLLEGRSLTRVAPEQRPLSLVFQKPLLFPHLTVAQNVGFALRMRRTRREVIRREVEDMLERVQLGGYGDRRPHELSGGQEQRVSLARALVQRPRVLLLDEPFSQLDAGLRAEMRRLVRELHDASGVTTLFVTHDREEAVEVADRIVLMLDGAVAGAGTPEEIYTRPPNLATARFFGVENELVGRVLDGWFRSADGSLRVATAAAGRPGGAGRPAGGRRAPRRTARHARSVRRARPGPGVPGSRWRSRTSASPGPTWSSTARCPTVSGCGCTPRWVRASSQGVR